MAEDTTRVPVDPPIHVERYPSHRSLTWHAPDLARVLAAVRAVDGAADGAPAVVDATNTAGRHRVALPTVDPGPATTYVRIEPEESWTFAWERRTENVAVLTGTPTLAAVRTLHRETGGSGWDRAARTAVERALSE